MKLIDAPKAFSSDDQCLADLEASHWPDGVCCPTCRAKDRLKQFEASLKKGREVLQETTDDRLLNTKWRMLAAGKLMSKQPRYVAIRDGVLNHMAHHRGQLTVYLRLNDEKVPTIYGPSADEGK
jgi:uncharacterized damage-inducible protein DinB